MDRAEILEGLAEIRRIAGQLREQADLPTLASAMSTVDTYCHMMQWQLGATHETAPALSKAE
ncbi:MAG: hypothetical protein Q8P59_00625 [Dehalococcoidia bacterium]|nr:hypothetical protein [Dehalococcoidia bacterium]